MDRGADERARLRPTTGARLLLELTATTSDGARYAGWVLTSDGERGFIAELSADGAAALTATGEVETTDDEAAADLLMLARLTARSAGKRAADGLPPWPPRVLRWRGPGRGG